MSYEEGIELTDKEFRLLADLIYNKFGINLGEKKKALVRGRLNSVLREKELGSFKEYYDSILKDESGSSLINLVDKISTNHSFFFRESEHFDLLEKVILPKLTAEQNQTRKIRIWSAGCAGGEEPYTLSMLLHDYFKNELGSWDIRMLATDISETALSNAKKGEYVGQKMSGLPDKYRKYLDVREKDIYAVKQQLKKLILFRPLNLMQEAYPFKGKFDIVFCRNVMIYFDLETRKKLLSRFHRYMKPGAYLFIGHSETLGRNTSLFNYVQPTVYTSA